MPRSSRTSQAAMASAVALSGGGGLDHATLWTSRGGHERADAAASRLSSTSVTSTLVSSNGDISEAESYAVRGEISGVETNHEDGDEDEDDDYDDNGNDNDNEQDPRGSSELLQGSDDDEDLGNAAEVDSLADASPEQVEAKVLERLGWNDIGQDKELPIIDLERWKQISDLHLQEGTPEYASVKAIQASLLEAVSELDSSDWLYPEPPVFSAGHLASSSSFSTFNGIGSTNYAALESSWTDAAFNPLSTNPPLAPTLSSTSYPSYPDNGRVRRTVESTRHPDLSFLDAQAHEYLEDQETSFSANGNFPWARSINTRPLTVSASTGRSSLAREVGVITI